MMKRKNAMILAEVLAALIICGILFLVSVYMFKGIDISRKPYVYSTIDQLMNANELIIDECFQEGACQKRGLLPARASDYCSRLADIFNTTGNVFCSTDDLSPDTLTGFAMADQDNVYHFNLRLLNGVSIYGLTKRSVSATQGQTGEQEDVNWTRVAGWNENNMEYIDILIDVNGKKGENTMREDVFPLRIFRNGNIVPGYYGSANNIENRAFEDRDGAFEYGINRHEVAEGNYQDDTKAALGYKTEANQPIETAELTQLSFQQAVCRAYDTNTANSMLENYYGSGNFTRCENNEQLEICQSDNNTAQDIRYCTVRQIKPATGGLFRIFGAY